MYNDVMLLILTHENADFDAVASQLAAQKLYPEGLPLLSWRINRNVEQFLTIYWDALPFLRPVDWQRKRVSRVVLVDTQVLPSVRGIRAEKVDVQVIDHHGVGDERDESWSYHTDQVGATTTLLVEMLQASGLSLSANEATLLLLGIHEDTGSLVYDTTTVRDARAATWLLEEGARLSVVRRFLNITLSDQQQQLYDHLQRRAEWKNIEGQSIVLSAVDAPPDFDDEISAVAHRLRDTMAPDGMFLLVQLKYNHIQLVARSSSDHIDVSKVARALGGGGHSRAAAATIMDRELTAVKEQIVELLPSIVKPMAKVSQIMSYGVQTLPTDTKISEAAEQMKRWGHEGYPVVDPASNELVGLLTRRMVDRALNHQMGNMPISQIMRSGRVTVRPSDSVDLVQRLMIREGWGQIPVIRDGSNDAGEPELIGIVTRTDLINLITDDADKESEPDMRQVMVSSLSPAVWGMVQSVGKVAYEMEMPLYFVGGLVRDLLLGKPPSDVDMVVEGDAIKMVRRLQTIYGGETRSHAQFGTAKWLLSPQVWHKLAPGVEVDDAPLDIDFVTARTEFYVRPSALPEVEQGSIKLDLHRRDFTINTLAVRLDGAHLGELLDFYGGLRDLQSNLIRVLHSLSFVDDPTRILRAVRLEQRLNFSIEPRTAELIKAALPMLDRVTGERIRNELEMCLRESQRVSIMARLAEIGALAQIHPGLTWQTQIAQTYKQADAVLEDPLWLETLAGESPAFVYFALLLLPMPPIVQDEVMSRLKVRKTTREDVYSTRSLLEELSSLPKGAKPSQVVFILRNYQPRVLLVGLIAVEPDSELGLMIDSYQRDWRKVRTSLNGNDLLDMGLKAGPQIGLLLDRLLAARLDGEIRDDEEERKLLEVLVESDPTAK
jgi:tRNA nucleotidyltransferase (CCA-adding enzyme)